MKIETLSDYVKVGKIVCSAPWHYNGFPPEVRALVNQPQREVKKAIPEIEPTVCDVTGWSDPADPKGRGYIFTHLENYSLDACLDWLPVSKLTHRILHARFVNPKAWFRYVAKHYRHGAWWTMLCMSPVKMFVRPAPGGGIMTPYWSVYPIGLPRSGEYWEDYATRAGISRDLFLAEDIRETIRFFWSFPGSNAAGLLTDFRPLKQDERALGEINVLL